MPDLDSGNQTDPENDYLKVSIKPHNPNIEEKLKFLSSKSKTSLTFPIFWKILPKSSTE